MLNRRDFLLQSALASSALGLSRTHMASAAQGKAATATPLKVLMLGGTGHIGQHFVRAAVERGHKVAVFSRGARVEEKSRKGQLLNRVVDRSGLPTGVEYLTGDRNGDLESLKHRDWDAVFDLTTFVPKWVRTLGEALKGRVRHYTFISSVSVYEDPRLGGTESGKVHEYDYQDAPDPYSLNELVKQKNSYAPLKVLCEREAEAQFPSKVLIARPGYIVGPNDRPGALPYLLLRIEQGGEVLAVGDPLTPVQWIDVRDLAEWLVRMAEKNETGIFNATGPALPMGFAELLGALRILSPEPVSFTWVPTQWVKDQGVPEWSNALFWATTAGHPGATSVVIDKARAHGLTFRPLAVTAVDTVAWYKSQPPEKQKDLFFLGTVEDSIRREAELLKTWHAEQIKKKASA